MGFLKRLVVVLLALAGMVAGVAFLLPRDVTVTRAVVIDAPPEQVFAHLDSLQKAAEWSSWIADDPAIRTSFAGPRRGVGNRMTWSSDRPGIGSGSQEIIASVPDERVEIALHIADMGVATAWQALKPEGGGTRVIWGLLAETGFSPIGRYRGLMMQRKVGADFEKGLANLKGLVEAG